MAGVSRSRLNAWIRLAPVSNLRDRIVYRLAVDPRVSAKTFRGMGIVDARRMLTLLGASLRRYEKYLLRELVAAPFTVRLTYRPQRWNTKDFPCFYSAWEPETAIEEVKHYARSEIRLLKSKGLKGSPITHNYLEFSCKYSGRTKDVRNLARSVPQIIARKHNRICHIIANQVRIQRFSGIIAPSVRRKGGICLPVFRKKSLRGEAITGNVTYYVNSVTKSVDHRLTV